MSEEHVFEFNPEKREWKSMDHAKAAIGYHQMRMVVMALHNQGEFLKHPKLTFSHGSYGNDFQKLGEMLDDMLADAEPRHEFIIMRAEPEAEPKDHNALAAAQLENLKMLLGMETASSSEVYNRVGALIRNEKKDEKEEDVQKRRSRITQAIFTVLGNGTSMKSEPLYLAVRKTIPDVFLAEVEEIARELVKNKLLYIKRSYYTTRKVPGK